ncbi:hypothetical protein HPB51_000715 [Rhipicephalus microplus]|uniref:Uncharacterized protein n=1 Tax=Rhipicephalus microplus TaxID=6941 RepID=A0A9J6E5Z8_RHIMP|nr:hypothetical protein HPB51_000715 [Rhipicephalus microplus]
MIRQIVREELGRRDAVNPPRAPAISTSRHTTQCVLPLMPRYMMCPNQEHQSPQPTTYIIAVVSRTPPANHHLQWCLLGTIMGTWRLVEGLVMRHPQQRYYEGLSASSRQNRWRSGMRSMRDAYVGDGFQQTTHSDTHVGRNFHRNLRNDSPSSVRSVTPATTRRFRSPSPGRRVTSPPPGN